MAYNSNNQAIQIIEQIEDHSFSPKNIAAIERILNSDNIRDRHVVIVSIAGAFRQGKSFLLNFYLQYMNARVSKILFCKMSYSFSIRHF